MHQRQLGTSDLNVSAIARGPLWWPTISRQSPADCSERNLATSSTRFIASPCCGAARTLWQAAAALRWKSSNKISNSKTNLTVLASHRTRQGQGPFTSTHTDRPLAPRLKFAPRTSLAMDGALGAILVDVDHCPSPCGRCCGDANVAPSPRCAAEYAPAEVRRTVAPDCSRGWSLPRCLAMMWLQLPGQVNHN